MKTISKHSPANATISYQNIKRLSSKDIRNKTIRKHLESLTMTY